MTLWHRRVGVVVFYGLVSVLSLYWPLLHFRTHVPGTANPSMDYYHFHWNYWWIRHALTTADLVYETNYVMFPFQHNLAYHTLTPFWFPLWAVTEPLIGTIGAFDAIFLVGMTLTGLCTFGWLRAEGVQSGWALFGGVVMQTAPVLLQAIEWSWVNMVAWFWLPTHLWLWRGLTEALQVSARRAVGWAIAHGVGLWLTGLTDFQYLLFLLFLLTPYAVYSLWQTSTTTKRLQLVGMGLGACGLALTLLYFAGPLSYMEFGTPDDPSMAVTPPEAAFKLRFPTDYLYGPDSYSYHQAPVSAVLLPLAIVAAGLAVWHRRKTTARHWLWLATAIVPMLLAAGSQVPFIYEPFHTALDNLFRFPLRFGPVFALPLLMFIGLRFQVIPHTRWFSILALLVVLADVRALRPMPIQTPPPSYDFYTHIGYEAHQLVVLEVPTAAGNGETWIGDWRALTLQYYGLTHGKPMVNGLLARTSPGYFLFMRTDDPMLSWLGQRTPLESELVEAQLRARIHEWPIGYIVIHQDLIGRHTPTPQEIIGYLNQRPDLVCPVWIERDAVVYRTTAHPAGCPSRTPSESPPEVYKIDIGAAGDERFLGWGWHWPETIETTWRWMGQYPTSTLHVDIPPGAYRLEVMVQAFLETRQLTLTVNGQKLDTVLVQPDHLQTLTFEIPAAVIGDGRHVTVEFSYDRTLIPHEIGYSSDPRPLAIAVDWVQWIWATP